MRKYFSVLLVMVMILGCKKEEIFTEVATYYVSCPIGFDGPEIVVTKTATSTKSNIDAYDKAYELARQEAESKQVCVKIFTEEVTYTAVCPPDYNGPNVVVTKTASSTESQGKAYSEAYELAKKEAEAKLVCVKKSTITPPSTGGGSSGGGSTVGGGGGSSSGTSCSAAQCTGTTKKGARCKNRTTNCSRRCYLH